MYLESWVCVEEASVVTAIKEGLGKDGVAQVRHCVT